MRNIIIVLLILLSAQHFPQRNPNRINGGKVFGKVFDYDSKHSIEYANIVLLSPKDSSLINGTISDVNGLFDLSGIRPGKYFLEVRFIGYKNENFDIEITRCE